MSNNRRFVPEMKMNKRDRSVLNKQKRNTWPMNPVSRVKPSGKVYTRKKVTDNGDA